LNSNLKSIEFSENSFDFVVDTFGLNYYFNPRKVLREMHRVCKEAG